VDEPERDLEMMRSSRHARSSQYLARYHRSLGERKITFLIMCLLHHILGELGRWYMIRGGPDEIRKSFLKRSWLLMQLEASLPKMHARGVDSCRLWRFHRSFRGRPSMRDTLPQPLKDEYQRMKSWRRKRR